MFRELFLKEWRQLRPLRWGGLALAALLPAAFVAGAEAARQGWALHALKEYSAKTLWGEALPVALAVGVWPLVTALMAAHAWCADRQDGTDAFLLARPLPASTIWRAKLAAVLASAGATMLVGAAIGATLAVTAVPVGKTLEIYGQALAIGVVAAVILIPAVWAAAAIIPSTLPAVLGGLVFVVIVAASAALLASAFPMATVGVGEWPLPVGLIVPWLMIPALAVASWHARVRGEPAGRGRAGRVGAVAGIATLLSAVLFLASAWGAVRWNTLGTSTWGWILEPSPGSALLVRPGASDRSVQLVDRSSLRRLRVFAAPVEAAAWNREGTVAAIATRSGAFGSVRRNLQILFVNRDGSKAAADVELTGEFLWGPQLAWSGTNVVALAPGEGSGAGAGSPWTICVVSPSASTVRRIAVDGFARQAWFDGPTETGELFVAFATVSWSSGHPSRRTADGPWRMFRIDAAAGTIVPESGLSGRGFPPIYRPSMSPSARWFVGYEGDEDDSPRVVRSRRTGDAVPTPPLSHPVWMHDDALVWEEPGESETRVLRARPGEAPEVLATWKAKKVFLKTSPDRRRLLVSGDAAAVWNADTRAWTEIPRLEEDKLNGYIQWAGPTTLAWRGPGYLLLGEVDAPDRRRVVFGAEPAKRESAAP